MSNKPPTEADIIFNRAAVALARSQRLIASWLPPRTADEEAAAAKSEEQLKNEDEELFKAVPESLGVGATPPPGELDGSFRRKNLSSNDRLLEQLLGKSAVKTHRATKAKPVTGGDGGALTVGTDGHARKVEVKEESDEEEGRAAMIKGRRGRKRRREGDGVVRQPETEETKAEVREEVEAEDGKELDGGEASKSVPKKKSGKVEVDDESGEESRPAKKRGGSYLDELLAEKARKKKKKKGKAGA